jgi:DsbC/DsbD-like thiol-disulfide interchange protein
MPHMHRKPYRIIIIAAFAAAASLALAPTLAAQDEQHVIEVSGLISRDAVRPGEIFKAAAVVKVQAGYHINDNAPLDEFLIPTTFVIDDHPDFEVVEVLFPKGRRARFSYSEAELVVYEGEVVIGVLLQAKAGAVPGAKTIKASVGYQACDNVSCLPPKELALSICVPVAAAGGADIHPEVFDKLLFRSLRK